MDRTGKFEILHCGGAGRRVSVSPLHLYASHSRVQVVLVGDNQAVVRAALHLDGVAGVLGQVHLCVRASRQRKNDRGAQAAEMRRRRTYRQRHAEGNHKKKAAGRGQARAQRVAVLSVSGLTSLGENTTHHRRRKKQWLLLRNMKKKSRERRRRRAHCDFTHP